MREQADPMQVQLTRIADALERLVPAVTPQSDWNSAPAFVWDGKSAHQVDVIEAPRLALLKGIERQKQAIATNIAHHAAGHAAHDMLLWGARGMGKSALIRSAVRAAQDDGGNIALVQVAGDATASLSALFALLAQADRQFVVYCDDLGFADGDSDGPRQLRSWLDGGVQARPANVRIAVTSNRRAIVPRQMGEQDDPINPRDVVDDHLALADRFGLAQGFHACSQDDYLEILHGYASEYALDLDEADALEWSKRRGARSGRIAWHYITELASRAGRALS